MRLGEGKFRGAVSPLKCPPRMRWVWRSARPYSLYDSEIATFEADDVYNQADAGGFINCFGLPMKVNAQMKKKNGLL